MIIRQDRQKLIELIHSYMDEKISAFQLDDELWELYTSKDKTVAWAAREIWHFYDDCIDHKIHARKEEWDIFWRDLLLLESNTEYLKTNIKNTWYWQKNQLPCLLLFCLFGFIVYYSKWDSLLLMTTIIFGLIGIFLYKKTRIKTSCANIRTYPFFSFSEIRSVRKKLCSFSKQSFPKHLKNRRTYRNLLHMDLSFLAYPLCMFVGPFALFMACLPQKQKHVSIQFSI